jgi:hypothetical protein
VVSIWPLSKIFLLKFGTGTVETVVFFVFFLFFSEFLQTSHKVLDNIFLETIMAYIDCGRKIKQKQKTPLSQQFQFQISKEKSLREAKLIPLIFLISQYTYVTSATAHMS